MITMMQGRTIRIRAVALMSPKEIEIAMGIRNPAWKDRSSMSGVRPRTVVMVVSRIGRSRRRPAATSASLNGSPSLRLVLKNCTRISESLTTIPLRATKPIRLRKVSS